MVQLLNTLRTPDANPNSWIPVIFWTVFGTLLAMAISYLYVTLVHAGSSQETRDALYFACIAMPLIVSPPVLIYLTMRNRELAIARGKLQILATTDSLTSCLNRRAFTDLVDKFLNNCASPTQGCHGALLAVDADNFKQVNDLFGHDAGDEALRLIVKGVSSVLREEDIAGRMGGEEFGVFLPGSDLNGAAVVSERIRQAISDIDFRPNGSNYPLSVSIGCAVFADQVAFRSLYRSADELMYSAKEHGRNRVEISSFSPKVAA